MNIIFTDIDGVLNPDWTTKWKRRAVRMYNKICEEFNLIPVITSTWRINYTKEELQEIFKKQGIKAIILDYTPNLEDDRGLEIKSWLDSNSYDNFVIIDDRITDIIPHVNNTVKCDPLEGLTKKEYEEIMKIMLK